MPYFKTSDAAAVAAFREWCKSISTHQRAALELSAEIGACKTHVYRYGSTGQFAAFIFDPGKEVPAHFRRLQNPQNGFYPRRSTKAGRELCERIAALPKVLECTAYNRAIGFSPCLIKGMRLCEFPATVSDADSVYFMIPDDALYTPPEHVTEILGSEYMRAQEAVELLKSKKTGD